MIDVRQYQPCTKELSAIYSVNQSAYSCRKPARKLWSFCGLNSVGPTPLPYKLEKQNKQNSSYCLSALGGTTIEKSATEGQLGLRRLRAEDEMVWTRSGGTIADLLDKG